MLVVADKKGTRYHRHSEFSEGHGKHKDNICVLTCASERCVCGKGPKMGKDPLGKRFWHPRYLEKNYLHNMCSPVQNENAKPLVEKAGGKTLLSVLKYKACSFLPLSLCHAGICYLMPF